MKTLLALIVLISFVCLGQNNIDSSNVIKWIQATINIESKYSYDTITDSLVKMHVKRKINSKEFARKLDSLQLLPRPTGTAIFFQHNNNYYLITARHVVSDPTTGRKNDIANIILRESVQTVTDTSSFKIDQGGNLYTNKNSDVNILQRSFIGNLFEYSSEQQDLALIRLDSLIANVIPNVFLSTLLRKGYKPINLSDIDTLCNLKNGDEIFSIGYPKEAEIGPNSLPRKFLNWTGLRITIPIVAYGTVGDNLFSKDFFSGNIFIYHGFSGGPVVSNKRLVGLVHGGGPVLNKNLSKHSKPYAIHKSFIIKSNLILPLLRILEKRKELSIN